MKHIVITAILTLSSCVCSVSTPTVIRVAEAAGLQDVKPDGIALMSCSKGDTFGSHFKAKNASGKPVKGTVCCGVFKDCTVRFE